MASMHELRIISQRCKDIWTDVARAMAIRERVEKQKPWGADTPVREIATLVILAVLYRCRKAGVEEMHRNILARIVGRVMLGFRDTATLNGYTYRRVAQLARKGLLEVGEAGDVRLTAVGEALAEMLETLLGHSPSSLG